MNLNPSDMIDNRYEIEKYLAAGGQGEIYLAKDTRLGSKCVLKRLVTSQHGPQELQEIVDRFSREAKLLASLRHSQLPKVTDYFYYAKDGCYYIAMDYILGQDLQKIIDEKKNNKQVFTIKEVLNIVKQIIDILKYLHFHIDENGKPAPIIYRDLKPSNIIIDKDRVYLLDFGIARQMLTLTTNAVSQNKQNQTRMTMIGTPGFAPLNQIQGKPNPSSDVYALAKTMWCMLTLSDVSEHPIHTILDYYNTDKEKITQTRSDVSECIIEAMMKAMNPINSENYKTIEEFEKSLFSETDQIDMKKTDWMAKAIHFAEKLDKHNLYKTSLADFVKNGELDLAFEKVNINVPISKIIFFINTEPVKRTQLVKASLLYLRGEKQQAVKIFDEYNERELAAEIYIELKEYQKALKIYTKLVIGDPTNTTYYKIIKSLKSEINKQQRESQRVATQKQTNFWQKFWSIIGGKKEAVSFLLSPWVLIIISISIIGELSLELILNHVQLWYDPTHIDWVIRNILFIVIILSINSMFVRFEKNKPKYGLKISLLMLSSLTLILSVKSLSPQLINNLLSLITDIIRLMSSGYLFVMIVSFILAILVKKSENYFSLI